MSVAPNTRVATPDDAVPLLEFWSRAAFGQSVSDDESSVTALLRHPTSRCLIATAADGTIVGSLIVGWDGWRLSLYRLAVDRAWRRQGIAGRLVGEASRVAASFGAVRLDAMVDVGNDEGEAFWASLGFRPNAGYTRFERMVRRTGSGARTS